MANVTPKICSGMQNTDVLILPGEVRQEGTGARKRAVILSLKNDDAGNLLLPDGSELQIGEAKNWLAVGRLSSTPVSGSAWGALFQFLVTRSGSGTAAISQFSAQQINGSSTPMIAASVASTNTIRLAVTEGSAHDWAASVEIVEVDRT